MKAVDTPAAATPAKKNNTFFAGPEATGAGQELFFTPAAPVAATPAAPVASTTGTSAPAIQAKFKDSDEVIDDAGNLQQLLDKTVGALDGARLLASNPSAWLDRMTKFIRSEFPEDARESVVGLLEGLLTDARTVDRRDITLLTALQELESLKTRATKEATEAKPPPLAIDYTLNILWKDIANYLMAGLIGLEQENPVEKKATDAAKRLQRDLDVMIKMMRDVRQFDSIELEALVNLLLQTRLAFAKANSDAERQRLGLLIGRLSRQAILLDHLLQLTPTSLSLTASPLEDKIIAEINNINWIRYNASTEQRTQHELNDNINLLSRNTVTVANPLAGAPGKDPDAVAPGSFKTDIIPDEAFPVLTDNASNKLMSELNDRIRQEEREVGRTKNAVIPEKPTYELDEFYAMYLRYYAFISHQREEQDSQYQLLTGLVKSKDPDQQNIYKLLGIDPGPDNPLGRLEGALGRAFLLMMIAQQLQQHQTGPAAGEFASVLNANPVRQVAKPATGTASDPSAQFGSFFRDPGSFDANASGAEAADRESFQREQQRISAQKFKAVANTAPPGRPDEAANQGLVKPADKKRPIVMKSSQAQDGWNFLVDVYDPIGSNVLVREQKVMPPEIVAYLLARQQLHETLANKHRPQANGKPIGDAGIIAGGVEGGTGSARSRMIEGKAVAEPSGDAKELAATIKQAPGNPKTQTARNNLEITTDLIRKIQAYFSGFYAARARQPQYSLASVLIIGNIEYDLFAEIKNTFDAHRIEKLLGFTVGITTGTAIAKKIGDKILHGLGDAISKGIGAYFHMNNVTNEAAIAGIVTFLANAAFVSNINEARSWAFLSSVIAGDVTGLFDNFINKAVGIGLEATFATAKEVYEKRQGKIPQSKESTTAKEKAKTDDKEPSKTEPVFSTLDPGAKKAALQKALPPELQGKVRMTATNKDGSGVRVFFEEGEIRVEYDKGAEPQNIRDHKGVVRELARYQGVVGAFRQLGFNMSALVFRHPKFNTKGHLAQLEVTKLSDIINERVNRLNTDPTLADSPGEARDIRIEIDDLYRQSIEHQGKALSNEKGHDSVAAKDNRSSGEALRIEKKQPRAPNGYYWRATNTGGLQLVNLDAQPHTRGNETFFYKYDPDQNKIVEVNTNDIRPRSSEDAKFTSKSWIEAYEELGGLDSTDSFGAFVHKLQLHFDVTPADIIQRMQLTEKGNPRASSPEGAAMKGVRHTTKQFFTNEKIIPYLTERTRISESPEYKQEIQRGRTAEEAYRAISHRRLMEYTDGLDSSDRGALGESWREMVYGTPGERQVKVLPQSDKANPKEPFVRLDIDEARLLDKVEGDTLIEVKTVKGQLGPRDKGEILDHVRMINNKVQKNGQIVRKLQWEIQDPRGAEPNREWMLQQLKAHDFLTFVIFKANGERAFITNLQNMDALESKAALKAFQGL